MSWRTSLALSLIVVSSTAVAHPGSGIAADRVGNIYFVDTGSGIWRMDAAGGLIRLQGPAFHWMALDSSGAFTAVPLPSSPEAEMRAVGRTPTLLMSSDFPVVVAGEMLVYPETVDGRVRLIRYSSRGARSVVATLPAATESGPLQWINEMAVGPDGSIYYTEDKAVRRVDGQGRITTIAGHVQVTPCNAIPGISSPERPYLRGVSVASDGTVYVAASGCGALLRIKPGGQVGVIMRTTSPWSPTGVATYGKAVYVLEYLHTASDNRREWLPRVRKLLPNGQSSVVATVRGGSR
jgi:sugar lactone lactonase YvrE